MLSTSPEVTTSNQRVEILSKLEQGEGRLMQIVLAELARDLPADDFEGARHTADQVRKILETHNLQVTFSLSDDAQRLIEIEQVAK